MQISSGGGIPTPRSFRGAQCEYALTRHPGIFTHPSHHPTYALAALPACSSGMRSSSRIPLHDGAHRTHTSVVPATESAVGRFFVMEQRDEPARRESATATSPYAEDAMPILLPC